MIARLWDALRTLRRSKFVQDTITLQAGKITLMLINIASFVVVARGLGAAQYGTYQLVLTLYGLLMTFNLTGLGPSTITRLAEAIGGGDRARIRDLMAFFLQISLVVAVVMLVVALLAGPALAQQRYGNAEIGHLLRIYVLSLFLTPVYHLTLITLQSTRAMRSYSVLENAGSLGETAFKIGAVLLGTGAGGVILALTLAASIKAAGGLILYQREQRRRPALLPGLGEVLRTIPRLSPRPYLRFGFLLALDKNIAGLFTLLPVDFVAARYGEEAAGFLRLGLNALKYPAILFKGILTNLESRLPADVGRGDYVRLRQNFQRVLRLLIPIAAALYGAVAIFTPLVVWVLGPEYAPAMPVIRVLCLFGFVTGIGGVFGPLYRTLRMAGTALIIKTIALLVAIPLGLWLVEREGAFGGAWMINAVFALTVGLTAVAVLRGVNRLVAAQGSGDTAR